MTPRSHLLTLAGVLLTCAACSAQPVEANTANTANTAPPGVAVEPRWNAGLRAIGREYASWGRVDDEYRWAPFLCRLPSPGLARFSGAPAAEEHGQKLYSLFARDRAAYVGLASPGGGTPVGQAVVKEAWVPEVVAEGLDAGRLEPTVAQRQVDGGPELDAFLPYARKDGVLYRAASRAGLYVILRLDAAERDTDAGWVYATLTPDGQSVTSSGRVASCMACHQQARHERLFGQVPVAPAERP